jgi:hypothetical protein
MTLTVQVPRDGCWQERAFIIEVLLRDRLGLDIRLEQAEVADTAIIGEGGLRLTMPDCFFPKAAEDWLGLATLPRRPLQSRPMGPGELPGLPRGGTLPVIFGGEPDEGALVRMWPRGSYLALDVFGSAFFMLSRYEEAVQPQRDWADRFPSGASLAQGEGFLDRPLVDEYLEILWRELSRLWPSLVRRPSAYRLRLSHDLDWPYATLGVPVGVTLRKLAGDLLVRHSASLGLQRFRSMVAGDGGAYALDPHNTFEFIMDTNEGAGHRGVFNFISGHTAPGNMDGVYSLDQPWIRHLLRRFRDRGHEVGLHPSFMTFRDGQALGSELANLHRAAEAEGIRQEAWGGRQHYLRWEASTTWRLYEEAGLTYDSTLGYADRPGFRCGTCHPYRTYDLQERHPFRLVERPMVAMDGTFFWKEYLGLPMEKALGAIQPLVEQCRAYAGEFVLLWHNTHLLTPEEKRLYQQIVHMAS